MKINVKVISGSKKQSIEKGEVWKIKLKNRAEKNKANIELINLLEKKFKKVRIIKGLKSKKKILEVEEK